MKVPLTAMLTLRPFLGVKEVICEGGGVSWGCLLKARGGGGGWACVFVVWFGFVDVDMKRGQGERGWEQGRRRMRQKRN